MRFYLWGPSSTGKTWLFDAFIKKVNLLDTALSEYQPDPVYSVWFEDQMGMRQHRYTLDAQITPATPDIDYQDFTFFRKYLLDDVELNQQALSFTHHFSMMDGQGDETTGQILIQANNEVNRAKVLAAHEALIGSDYLIICVERGQRNLEENGGNNAGLHYVEKLRDLLKLKRKNDQEIIICFTKADLYGGKVAGFDSALLRLFGSYGKEVGNLLREINGNWSEPRCFFVSAVGYYRDINTNKAISNFSLSDNKLIEMENWNPFEVEKPFFNVLTKAEKKSLQQFESPEKNFVSRLLGKGISQKDLVNKYISYEQMIKYYTDGFR